MGTSALGGFMEGLQGGIKARDEMDLNKQYKSLLSQKIHENKLDFDSRETARRAQWQQDYNTMEGFEPMEWNAPEDPALVRFGGWLKGKMGLGGGEEAAPSASGITPVESDKPLSTPVGNPPEKVLWKADGGAISDEERMKRSYGDYWVTEEEAAANRAARSRGEHTNRNPYHGRYGAGVDRQGLYNSTSGGGPKEFYNDLVRNAGDVLDDTFQGIRNYGMAADQAIEDFRDSKDARDAGGAFRRSMGDAYGATMNVVGGVMTDVGDLVETPLDFLKGVVDWGDGEQQAVPDKNAPEKAAVKGRKDAPDKSDEDIAQEAISTGERAAAENFDYRYLPEDTRPEDMPSMNTQDWTDYRAQMMQAMLMRGKDPDEAYQIVDDITVGQQMKGMERELRKAMNYLQMGDYRATMFAIRQGFQYFPNGVDVKFAVQTNPKTGEQALVSFGISEETGEPVGTPQIITPATLSVMGQNFSDPDKFRQWTKDGQDLQLEIAKFKDTSKYRQESLDIQEANAITDRMRANTAARNGGAGGMDYSDTDRRSTDIRELLTEAEFNERVPEGLGPKLSAYGEEVMRYYPDAGASTISEMLIDAWNAEGEFKETPGGAATVEALIDSIRKRATGN